MLLYLARIYTKKQQELLDLFHRRIMQVELFFIYLVKLMGETDVWEERMCCCVV